MCLICTFQKDAKLLILLFLLEPNWVCARPTEVLIDTCCPVGTGVFCGSVCWGAFLSPDWQIDLKIGLGVIQQFKVLVQQSAFYCSALSWQPVVLIKFFALWISRAV